MKQPQGYSNLYNSTAQSINRLVCRLNKTLYGLCQASHDWFQTLHTFLLSIDFIQCVADTCIYIRTSRTGSKIIIGVFVDDLPIAYNINDEMEWLEIKSAFMSRFQMKDLGQCKLILGMRVTRDRVTGTLHVDNQVHIEKMLSTFRMDECKPAVTPASIDKLSPTTKEEEGQVDKRLYQSMVGALNYLVQASRPDISNAVNNVCRFASNPALQHFKAVKRIMRYLAGTPSLGLLYSGGDRTIDSHRALTVNTFTDADWGGDIGDRKSTSGYLVCINNCTVSWATKKQQTVALSTAEAEYMAISAVVQEIIWIRSLITEMLGAAAISKQSIIYCDNQAAASISRDDVHHARTKHIDIKHHFIRQHIADGSIAIKWITTNKQTADVLTKALGENKFNIFRTALMDSTHVYD